VRTVRTIVQFLAPRGAQVIGAILLGTLATLFAVSLTGLSGWLIVSASQQPPIMYLLVAIVGVRFFGIGRAVLRYSERLLSHSAVFAAVTTLRGRLWDALAGSGLRSRSLLRGGTTLDHLVGDVDQVRDLSIRVALPAVTGSLSVIVAVIALGIVYPPVLALFVPLALAGIIAAPLTALIADRSASRAQQSLRGTVLRRFAAMLIAADDLRVNGVDDRVRLELQSLDARGGRAARHGAWALGLGSAVVVLTSSLAAVLVLPATAGAVASGTLRPELVAVLALTPLGLIDPMLELVAAVQNYPSLRRVLGRLQPILQHPLPAQPLPDADRWDSRAKARVLTLENVAATWPDTEEPVFEHVNTEVRRGEWLVVTGASGSGKSTLLAVLLGQLPPSAGRYLVNGHPVIGTLGARVGWCPQESHLFDSTLRGNLLLARGRADAPRDTEMLTVLRRVGLGALLDRLPDGLDTMIGAGGHSLSGGERQRVAVARTLLTRCEIILIDEPTAHLDAESADALMTDLRLALSERITVLVTHHRLGLLPQDIRVDLDQPSVVPPLEISSVAVGGAASASIPCS
jgi:ATP-binding cassette subfamily C protein CydCD